MQFVLPAIAVVLLAVVALVAGSQEGGRFLLTSVVPYGALAVLFAGVCWRVIAWSRSPVPFRIPTTCGQQKSLPWIKSAPLDNPSTPLGAAVRVALELFLFRSLFRNTKAQMVEGRYVFADSKILWLAALSLHVSLLIIVLRHLRFILQPVPGLILFLGNLDGFLEIGLPALYLTDAIAVCALLFLLARRFLDPKLRYISQFSDYFALFLLLGIAVSGMLMRYFVKIDLVAVKKGAIGLATLHPVTLPDGNGVFLVHLLLVCTLAAYIPFSKLMHFGAVFLSPTRNLPNDSRAKRHVNPWNHPVKTHPYAEWEHEYRDKIKMAGIPLEEESHG